MPITLKSLRAEEREIKVPVGGEHLTVWYRPGALTPELEDASRQAEDEGSTAPLRRMLSLLVSRWDLSEDEGKKPVPITQESLARVPSKILVDIVTSIGEDHRPEAPAAGS